MPPARPPSRLRRSALLLLAATALALAGAELGLRIFRPVAFRDPRDRSLPSERERMHRKSRVPGLLYELVPGYAGVHEGRSVRISSLGMRDQELLPAELHARRIAVVGDSVAFGLGVEDGETFSDELERVLDLDARADGGRVEVLNLGVSGYSIADNVAVVEHVAPRYAPELVLVAYSLNDPDVEPVQQLQHVFANVEWWEHSELLRLIAWKKRVFDTDRYGGGDVFRYLHAREGPAWRHVPEGFAKLRALESQGFEVVIVVAPTFFGFRRADAAESGSSGSATSWTSWDEYPYAAIHAQVIEAARAAGLEAWDLREDIRASGLDPGDSMADFAHPNAAGHRAIGRALAKRIEGRARRSAPSGTPAPR
jgi:lysophospholipase L1-like esterase